jgi:glycerol-3-phosphate acyltransferase PlsY
MIVAAAAVVVSYLLGAIPFAVLLTRWGRGIDVRRVGSGNPGATNVWRSAGPGLGLAVLILDGAKGAAAVLIARAAGLDRDVQALAGLAAIAGHVWPVWLRFRGGKGVATGAGVFAVLAPWAVIVAIVVFAIGAGITRYVSIGSLVAAIALTVSACVLHEPPVIVTAAAVAAAIVVFRHRDNIARLRRGAEKKF